MSEELNLRITTDMVAYRELLEEVEFLRYFYAKVYDSLGCAVDDVYVIIKENFVDEGGKLPVGYGE
jgi:hypothetical protein